MRNDSGGALRGTHGPALGPVIPRPSCFPGWFTAQPGGSARSPRRRGWTHQKLIREGFAGLPDGVRSCEEQGVTQRTVTARNSMGPPGRARRLRRRRFAPAGFPVLTTGRIPHVKCWAFPHGRTESPRLARKPRPRQPWITAYSPDAGEHIKHDPARRLQDGRQLPRCLDRRRKATSLIRQCSPTGRAPAEPGSPPRGARGFRAHPARTRYADGNAWCGRLMDLSASGTSLLQLLRCSGEATDRGTRDGTALERGSAWQSFTPGAWVSASAP